MIEIKDLLARFSNLLLGEEARKAAVIDVLKEVVGIDVKSEDIKIKNNMVYLNIKPIYKNEILLKQDKIFSKLKESMGKKTPQEIR